MPLFRYIFFFKCVYISLLFNLQTPNILDKLVLQLLLKNLHHKLKRFQKITGRSSNSHWETFNKTSLASLEIILKYMYVNQDIILYVMLVYVNHEGMQALEKEAMLQLLSPKTVSNGIGFQGLAL